VTRQCRDCRTEAAPTSVYCEAHRERNRLRANARLARLRDANLCRTCRVVPPAPGIGYCTACRGRRRDRYVQSLSPAEPGMRRTVWVQEHQHALLTRVAKRRRITLAQALELVTLGAP
jgi:hypothetical protein